MPNITALGEHKPHYGLCDYCHKHARLWQFFLNGVLRTGRYCHVECFKRSLNQLSS